MTSISDFKEYVLKYQLGYTLDNVSFKCLTSLGVGGTCKLLYIPDDIESLTLCIKYLINKARTIAIIAQPTHSNISLILAFISKSMFFTSFQGMSLLL